MISHNNDQFSTNLPRPRDFITCFIAVRVSITQLILVKHFDILTGELCSAQESSTTHNDIFGN